MRILMILVFGLVACAPAEMSESARLAHCTNLFKFYDRAVLQGSEARARYIGDELNGPDSQALYVSGMKQHKCQTNLPSNPAELISSLKQYRNDGRQSLGNPTYLHIGATRTRAEAEGLGRIYTELGYNFRLASIQGFGWRVFVGPLGAHQTKNAAQVISARAGFGTTYLLPRIPWSQ